MSMLIKTSGLKQFLRLNRIQASKREHGRNTNNVTSKVSLTSPAALSKFYKPATIGKL